MDRMEIQKLPWRGGRFGERCCEMNDNVSSDVDLVHDTVACRSQESECTALNQER
jgi:hypothetical protein